MKPLLLKSLFRKLKYSFRNSIEEWHYERSWRSKFVEVQPTNRDYENAMYQEVIITGRPLGELGIETKPKRYNLVDKNEQ